MKTVRANLLIAPMMVFLPLLSFAPSSSAGARQNPIPSKKEMKVLLKTAKTPAEHLRIAGYYQQEAQRLTDHSRRDVKLAARYEDEPLFPALEAGKGIAFSQGVTHYGRWAKFEAQRAEKATKLAAMHE